MTETEAHDIDKISEALMATVLGVTVRALQGRRARGQIPEGVWMKHGGRIIYSKKRYDEWLESQWTYPQESTYTTGRYGSDSPGKVADVAKRFPIPRHKRASKLHPSFAIR